MTRPMPAAAAAIAIILSAPAAAQRPQPGPERFAYERAIVAPAAGPHRLPVDAALLAGGRPFRVVQRGETFVALGGLEDLRMFDASGRPVPYLLVHPPSAAPEWIAGTVVPVTPTKKTSGFEIDLGRVEPVNMMRVEGIPPPFLKRMAVEGSGDRTRWTSLAPEATLFDLPAERLKQLDVGFTPGEYRYLRVTWNDANSGRVPSPRAVRARRAGRTPPAAQAPLELTFERQASEPGRSRYRVRLPAPRLPIVALQLDVDGGHVFRRAAVTESRFAGTEAAPVELGRATLSRVVRDGIQASDLDIPIVPPTEAELQLLIDDESNPPLELRRMRGIFAELPAIYFEFEPAGAGLVARYGDRALPAPAYDLEAVRDSIDLTQVPEARWGTVRALGETEGPPASDPGVQPGSSIDAEAFGHLRSIAAADAGLAALQLDAAALAGSRGPAARFADVRILDESGRQIPYLIERRDEPLQVELAPARADTQAPGLARPPGRALSVYKVTLPYAGLPQGTLIVETSARVFQRSVQLGVERPPDRGHRDTWFDLLASGTWRHADKESAARPLSMRFTADRDTALLLAIDEGDNAPLPVTGARLLLPSYRLRFYHPGGGALRLVYGREDLRPPQYDLALLAQQVMGAPARDVTAGDPPVATTAAGGASFISPLTFWILLGGAVVVLVGIIARLVKGA